MDFVGSSVGLLTADSGARDAIGSLTETIGEKNFSDYPVEAALQKWLLVMKNIRHAARTDIRDKAYKLQALYKSGVDDGILPQTDGFKPIMAEISADKNRVDNQQIKGCNPVTALEVAKEFVKSSRQNIYKDIYILCVLGRGQLAPTMAKAKRPYPARTIQEEAICLRNQKSVNQSYIFQLGQNVKREKALVTDLMEGVQSVINVSGLDFDFAPDSPTAAWIEAAQECGYPDRDIKACIQHIPQTHGYLAGIEASELSDAAKDEIAKAVASHIIADVPRWYLIRLSLPYGRPLTRDNKSKGNQEKNPIRTSPYFATADADTKALDKFGDSLVLFYPFRTLLDKSGPKAKWVSEPVISNFLFVRTNETLLGAIEPKLEGLGRIQRNVRAEGQPYAIVNADDMVRFQRFIGQYTADNAVETATEDNLNVGDTVYLKGWEGGTGYKIVEILDKSGKVEKMQLRLALADGGEHTITISATEIMK